MLRNLLMLIAVTVWCMVAATGAEPERGSLLRAPLLRKAPIVDGKMSPGEWDGAAQVQPFMEWRRKQMEPRSAKAWVGYTADRLYIAAVTAVPPTGPRATKKFNDARLISDSGLEVWIDPNRANRKVGEGALSFYQFIGNSIGTIRDVEFDPRGAPNIGWSGTWTFKNSVDEKAQTWTAELSIPWSDFGWKPGTASGRTIGLLIARNFKAPWAQVTWMPFGAAFVNKSSYPEVHLAAESPVVRIEQVGKDFFTGGVDMKVRIVNSTDKARKADVDLVITSTDMPKVGAKKVLEVAAGGSAVFSFAVPHRRLHADARHTLNLLVTDAESGQVLMRHMGGQWTQPRANLWHVRTGPNLQAAVKLAYYPSYKFVRVLVDPRELSEEAGEEIKSAAMKLTDSEGKVILDKQMKWDAPPAEEQFEVGDLPSGDYEATVTLKGWKEPFVRPLWRRRFAWEGSRMGITTHVYPPFKPIEVTGKDVRVVLRRYACGGLGLWDEVESVGRNILAGPVALRADGERALAGAGKFVETAGHEVVYAGEAEDAAVKVQTRCVTEYDGCMKVELALKPGTGKKELKSLWLEIPVKDSEAPLWHVSTTALRANPAGFAPKGEGRIWDSRDFPDGEWWGGFRPYIWLGAEERGICWFADNDRGWVLNVDEKKGTYAPGLSLHREGGALTLRVHLVQKPTTIQEPRKIVFGLMASPAKPMPKDWRAIGRPDHKRLQFTMGHVYGLPNTYSAKYPLHKDFSQFDYVQSARLGTAGDRATFIKHWESRHLQGMGEEARKKFSQLFRIGMGRGRQVGQNLMTSYFEEFHTTSYWHDEVPTYYSEWTGRYLPTKEFRPHHETANDWMWGIGTGALVDSYQDFATWMAAQWVRRGFGCYFDNSFPKRAYDPLTTSAYRLPNGRIQPSAGIWAHREYLKRVWVIHQQLSNPRTPGVMMIHMTNTHIVPYMVWNYSNLDLEWLMTAEPAQAKYAPDLLRAESIGLQTGNVPVVIAGVRHGEATKAQRRQAGRTRWAAMLVHEIKPGITVEMYPKPLVEFGYGLPDCKVWNYWTEKAPLTVSDPACKWLLLKRGGRLMVVLCTWNGKPSKPRITLDLKGLGVEVGTVVDAESGEQIGTSPGQFSLDLQGYGVKVLRLE